MPLWLRTHLVPAQHETIGAGRRATCTGLCISPDAATMEVIGDGAPEGAWTVSNQTITTDGEVFTGPADPTICGPRTRRPRRARSGSASLGLRQDLIYHPDSHFWPLQWAETGVFVGLAALLAGFCFWWIRRRVS